MLLSGVRRYTAAGGWAWGRAAYDSIWAWAGSRGDAAVGCACCSSIVGLLVPLPLTCANGLFASGFEAPCSTMDNRAKEPYRMDIVCVCTQRVLVPVLCHADGVDIDRGSGP